MKFQNFSGSNRNLLQIELYLRQKIESVIHMREKTFITKVTAVQLRWPVDPVYINRIVKTQRAIFVFENAIKF